MDNIEYHCSAGHEISAPHALTQCLVWGCHGTLTEQRRPGPKKKTAKKDPPERRAS